MFDVLLICVFIFAVGACIGSFLNVVALRSLSKESIVFPSSKCPVCNEPIKWYDNIPVFSYLFTFKGKCRNCGCKVSPQYPIVEAVTSFLFFAVVFYYGFTLETLLILFLLCIAIVITITDLKKEYVFDVHMWLFIVGAIVYSLLFKHEANNALSVCLGVLVGAVTMEALARLSYYLVRKEDKKEEAAEDNEPAQETQPVENTEVAENSENTEAVEDKKDDEEDIDINEYVKKNKRAFGEGDTYLAAGVGALLGWKYFIFAVALAIIVQAVCILPQFFVGLYKQKEYRLLFSLSAFVVIAVLYWILSNIFTLNVFLVFGLIIALIFFAIDSIQRLKKTVNEQGFIAIPFGPALLFSAFMMLFFGKQIVGFLIKYIFMILG